MVSWIGLIVVLELLILIHISRSVQFYNPLLFFVAVPLFYANAFYFDYILSGYDLLTSPAMGLYLSVHSTDYFFVVALTFCFILGVYLAFLLRKTDYSFSQNREALYLSNTASRSLKNPWLIATLTIFLLILFTFTFESFGLDRYEQKALYNNPLRSLVLSLSFIYVCLVISSIKANNFVLFLILSLMVAYSFINFEREYILMTFYAFLLRAQPKRVNFYHVLLFLIVLALLVFYKPIMWYFYSIISGYEIVYITDHKPVSFSFSDPAVSTLLVSDFISNSGHYEDYYGSYIVNTIMQFLRTFFSIEWSSLGEYATNYFTGGDMGTAFSMIVESMLNFWYFGPIITGFLLTVLFFKIEIMFAKYLYIIYFLWFLFIFKFVRTELAVVLKLYILPGVIAAFFIILAFKYFSKKRLTCAEY